MHCWQGCMPVQLPWKHTVEVIQEIQKRTIMLSIIPFLDTQSNERKSLFQREICIPMFIAALFTVALVQEQPEYLSTGEWIKTI